MAASESSLSVHELAAPQLLQAASDSRCFCACLASPLRGSEATSQDEWKATQLLEVPVYLASVLDDHTGGGGMGVEHSSLHYYLLFPDALENL